MEAQVVPGGIKIAAIDQVCFFLFYFAVVIIGTSFFLFFLQEHLEYDPALYQRDRGELDWDARSIASTAVFGEDPAGYNNSTSKFAGYDKYLAHGPGSVSEHEIELKRFDTAEEPLLSPRSMAMHQQGFTSQQSLAPSLPASSHYSTRDAAPLHRPGQESRSYSPSPAYMSTESLNQGSTSHLHLNLSNSGQSPVSPYPGSEFTPTQEHQHQRSTSGNLLAGGGRAPSPGPHAAMGYPPQQHGRQPSGNMLGSRTPSPGPYQAYSSQQQHARQASGNMLAQGRPADQQQHTRQASGNMLAAQGRAGSPGPYQAYSPPQQHGRQPSGNVLASPRSGSPGPYQAYAPQQQQHARQPSGSPLAGSPGRAGSPGPYQAYSPQQQHARQGSGNLLASPQGRVGSPGPNQAYSPQQGYSQPPPGLQPQPRQANNNNMAGRGAHRG